MNFILPLTCADWQRNQLKPWIWLIELIPLNPYDCRAYNSTADPDSKYLGVAPVQLIPPVQCLAACNLQSQKSVERKSMLCFPLPWITVLNFQICFFLSILHSNTDTNIYIIHEWLGWVFSWLVLLFNPFFSCI
jgi:hypothetical protein